jgi:hypothetical protein
MRAWFAVAVALLLSGCRQNDDPDGAKALYAKANEGAGFRAAPWRRAPDFPERKPSFTAHSREVEIWVNEPMAKALDGIESTRVTNEKGVLVRNEWPVGSIIVKEGFSGDERQIVAIMERRADGWVWIETDGEGEPLWSATNGKPDICVGCHDNRADYSDWVYSIEFPR